MGIIILMLFLINIIKLIEKTLLNNTCTYLWIYTIGTIYTFFEKLHKLKSGKMKYETHERKQVSYVFLN